MWTPRRVLLLLAGLAVVVGGLLVYVWFLGGYDGLPVLPPAYLKTADRNTPVPGGQVGTTVGLLQLAFGRNSPEGASDVRAYRHRLPITGRNGVMAIGPPQTDGTPRVVVAPVSVALFGQRNPRPKPGEQVEITTLHADRATITFDRNINRVEDMTGAKVVSLNLESDPDDDPKALATEGKRDPRKGRTWVSNNRKSADPSDHLIVRTAGPLFVQLPDDTTPYDPNTKHIWDHRRGGSVRPAEPAPAATGAGRRAGRPTRPGLAPLGGGRTDRRRTRPTARRPRLAGRPPPPRRRAGHPHRPHPPAAHRHRPRAGGVPRPGEEGGERTAPAAGQGEQLLRRGAGDGDGRRGAALPVDRGRRRTTRHYPAARLSTARGGEAGRPARPVRRPAARCRGRRRRADRRRHPGRPPRHPLATGGEHAGAVPVQPGEQFRHLHRRRHRPGRRRQLRRRHPPERRQPDR